MMTAVRPLLLAIDTATPCAALALTAGTADDGEVRGCLNMAGGKTHSRRLLLLIDVLMRESGTTWQDVDGIAVGLGPGSFTGLRIGMATAKGLATATGRPLYGVSTLDVLAAQCAGAPLVCSMIDARKKEVYAALYRRDVQGRQVMCAGPLVLPPVALASMLLGVLAADESVLLVGSGARLYGAELLPRLGGRGRVAPAFLHEPSAAALGLAAGEKVVRGEDLDPIEGMPLYVRGSDAELNLARKLAQAAGEGGR